MDLGVNCESSLAVRTDTQFPVFLVKSLPAGHKKAGTATTAAATAKNRHDPTEDDEEEEKTDGFRLAEGIVRGPVRVVHRQDDGAPDEKAEIGEGRSAE